MSIDIVAIRTDKKKYWLRVRLEKNGDLVLEGQDLSPGLEEMFGRDEYEYWYTVKAAAVPKLLETLGGANGLLGRPTERSIAAVLRERFGEPHGISASTEFKAWCKAHDVPYTFASY